jgi:hypothetical protein
VEALEPLDNDLKRIVRRTKGMLDSGDSPNFKELARHLILDRTIFHRHKTDQPISM